METHVAEKLADFVNDGILDAKLIDVESEHSALSACIGAQATGTRTFTATASQGLALMHEVLFIASGMRLPIVMAVINRALSAPINIWNDHSDSIASRDSGWLQFYVESSQEAFDTIIQAYKIAENKNVVLPVMVCFDGFTLSHVWEPVDFSAQKNVDKFLPIYNPGEIKLDSAKPITMGPIGFPNSYMEFKKQQQDAILKSIEVIKKINREFGKKFGRSYGDGLIETYKVEDADQVLMGMGSLCGTARVLIDGLRKKGKKVGLIKVRCFRPFPIKELQSLIKKNKRLKRISVLDRDISFGNNGALYTEVKDALYNSGIKVNGFIVGLGGRDITKETLMKALKKDGGWLF